MFLPHSYAPINKLVKASYKSQVSAPRYIRPPRERCHLSRIKDEVSFLHLLCCISLLFRLSVAGAVEHIRWFWYDSISYLETTKPTTEALSGIAKTRRITVAHSHVRLPSVGTMFKKLRLAISRKADGNELDAVDPSGIESSCSSVTTIATAPTGQSSTLIKLTTTSRRRNSAHRHGIRTKQHV